jgi:hypothetical protein
MDRAVFLGTSAAGYGAYRVAGLPGLGKFAIIAAPALGVYMAYKGLSSS